MARPKSLKFEHCVPQQKLIGEPVLRAVLVQEVRLQIGRAYSNDDKECGDDSEWLTVRQTTLVLRFSISVSLFRSVMSSLPRFCAPQRRVIAHLKRTSPFQEADGKESKAPTEREQ